MARVLGRLSKIMVSADAGTTWLTIKGLKEGTFSGSRSEIKTTAHDDGDFENYLPGRIDASVDLKLFYDDADAGQLALVAAWLAGTSLLVKYIQHPGNTGGGTPVAYKEYSGTGMVTKHEEVGGDNDAAMLNTTIRVQGPFVQQAQPATPDQTPA